MSDMVSLSLLTTAQCLAEAKNKVQTRYADLPGLMATLNKRYATAEHQTFSSRANAKHILNMSLKFEELVVHNYNTKHQQHEHIPIAIESFPLRRVAMEEGIDISFFRPTYQLSNSDDLDQMVPGLGSWQPMEEGLDCFEQHQDLLDCDEEEGRRHYDKLAGAPSLVLQPHKGNATLVEIYTFFPKWMGMWDVQDRVIGNGGTAGTIQKIIARHRHFRGEPIENNSIFNCMKETNKKRAKFDSRFVGWGVTRHPKETKWADDNLDISTFQIASFTYWPKRTPAAPIPFKTLAKNVKKMPTGYDALDLTRCIQYHVNNPDEIWMYPNDYQALLDHIGGPIPVTPDHWDRAALARYNGSKVKYILASTATYGRKDASNKRLHKPGQTKKRRYVKRNLNKVTQEAPDIPGDDESVYSQEETSRADSIVPPSDSDIYFYQHPPPATQPTSNGKKRKCDIDDWDTEITQSQGLMENNPTLKKQRKTGSLHPLQVQMMPSTLAPSQEPPSSISSVNGGHYNVAPGYYQVTGADEPFAMLTAPYHPEPFYQHISPQPTPYFPMQEHFNMQNASPHAHNDYYASMPSMNGMTSVGGPSSFEGTFNGPAYAPFQFPNGSHQPAILEPPRYQSEFHQFGNLRQHQVQNGMQQPITSGTRQAPIVVDSELENLYKWPVDTDSSSHAQTSSQASSSNGKTSETAPSENDTNTTDPATEQQPDSADTQQPIHHPLSCEELDALLELDIPNHIASIEDWEVLSKMFRPDDNTMTDKEWDEINIAIDHMDFFPGLANQINEFSGPHQSGYVQSKIEDED
ncbi:hypothetical protein BS50DRAFT_630936 [Corynespora cassiicola Philippines]|uniref:Uncharacterized protein n=1 Tax=Corynespora cassiicola Philippines TaxID=1448308 RepID=A0A2T2P0J6_CORCC|nr:hypothetical protein BS50DRAFT_630936 [Corynespora cassiicola Philippines]